MKLNAPAALRNRQPIADVLSTVVPATGRVLEIAAGSGQHAVFLSETFPELVWQPTDRDVAALASIDAWRAEVGPGNLLPARPVDVASERWWEAFEPVDVLVSINMIHISPWESALGLFRGARELVADGGVVYLYGPFSENGGFEAPSNAAFDQSLRARDPRWGVRALEDVTELARESGFDLERTVPMPANNLSVIFRR